jgi:RimJ/RimL family protein N-acetyltransferase
VAYGFDVLHLDKICAYIESDNTGSSRVAEKAGLRVVSTFPGERTEELWMEIRSDEFYKTSTEEAGAMM